MTTEVTPIDLYSFQRVRNFGDALAADLMGAGVACPVRVVDDLSKATVVSVGTLFRNGEGYLYGVEQPAPGKLPHVAVFGTGFRNPVVPEGDLHRYFDLNVYALRGKLSEEVMRKVGYLADDDHPILGDPGLLYPDLVPDCEQIGKICDFAVVPHYYDQASGRKLVEKLQAQGYSAKFIDVLAEDSLSVIREVAASRAVLSSSLHGLIVADAMNIPNRRVIFGDISSDATRANAMPDFKYADYYSAFDVEPLPPIRIDDADDSLKITFDDVYLPIPFAEIEKRKVQLRAALEKLGQSPDVGRRAPIRVLFAVNGGANKITANTFVATLAKALEDLGADVDRGVDLFWNATPGSYDIVHLQWPEALIGWNSAKATEEFLQRLRYRLAELKAAGAKIVYTRHNRKPHKISGENINKLTEIFETEADAIVHMGETSKRECLEANPNSAVRHVVIPHHLKDEIDFSITREEARAKLGIAADAKVMLAFGAFRHEEEVALVNDAVKGLDIPNFKLLAPLCPGDTYKGLVPDNELPAYFAAADIVFLQRVKVLNSGVLPLAYDAARVCVGPGDGNAGEILAATGNPTFDPSDHASVVDAIKRGFSLAAEGKGKANRAYARERWSQKQVAEQHITLYHDLLCTIIGDIQNEPHRILTEAWIEMMNGRPVMRNWGDDLNWFLLRRLTNLPIEPVASAKIIMPDDIRLLFIGSGADSRVYDEHSVVWGTGSLYEDTVIKTRPRKVCAVRGPLTREKFLAAGIDCPDVYGDPALLLPIVYHPNVERKYKLGVAVHFREWHLPHVVKFRQNHPEILFIDLGDYVSWTDIPDKICSCEAIASSSLHALIVADAYQVPNVLIKFSDLVKGGTWKFRDYFAGVGREFFEPLDFSEDIDLSAVDTLSKKYRPIHFDPDRLLSVAPIPLNIRPVVGYNECSGTMDEKSIESFANVELDYYLNHAPREDIDEFRRGMEWWIKKEQSNLSQVNVSVVIPVYNAEKYIDRCLESVLNQNLSLEIICVDDCSTDKSYEICQARARKDPRIRALRMPRNSFAGRCRNYGAAMATGEYLMFMDADDELEAGVLTDYYKLAKGDNLEVLRGTARAFDDATGEIIERSYYQQEHIKGKVCEQAISLQEDDEIAEMAPVPWIGIALTSFIKRNNLSFDALKCSNDVSFFFGLISKAKRIRFLRKSIVLHRVNNKSSLMGIRALNYRCVLESTQIVYRQTHMLHPALKVKIMGTILSAYPRWIRQAKACAENELVVVRDFREHLRTLDLNFFEDEIERTYWYRQLVDLLGEDPLGIEAKLSRTSILWRARLEENRNKELTDLLAENKAKLDQAWKWLDEVKARASEHKAKLNQAWIWLDEAKEREKALKAKLNQAWKWLEESKARENALKERLRHDEKD